MYLRNLKDIKIGGISNTGISKIYPDNSNCVIKSVEKDTNDNLIVHLIKIDENIECTVYIKSETEDGKSILGGILHSKKILGKTINELLDSKIDDLY